MPHVCLEPDLSGDHLAGLTEALQGRATIASAKEPTLETTHWVTGRATESQLDLPHLKAIIVAWAGVPQELREGVAARPHLSLYNLHHNALTTAEMAVGLLIAAARGIADGDRQLREGKWYGRMDERQGVLLAGKRAVILGYGSIGGHVGRILSALGMEIAGIRRQVSDDAHGIESLDDQLAQSHALVICAPLTEETRGLIDSRRIGLLQPPRLLVNVGRGAIVDEAALFEACRDGVLFAAGIDTWYSYPKSGDKPPVWPSQFPFQDLRNVVMSPHRGGDGDETERNRLRELSALLLDLLQGVPRKSVDTTLGY